MTENMNKTDVVIIGAGPTGLFAVFECGTHKLKCHVFDALEVIGGQCAALYPEKPIYDIPAYARVTGEELVQNLEAQIAPFNPQIHLSEQVVSVTKTADGFTIEGSKGTVVECRAIIIAAGVGAFGPNRPPLAHLEEFEASSVHYCVKSRATYAGKDIVIAGGGDSAVDWALSLSEIAKSVSLVHRRPKFKAAPESEARLKQLADAGVISLVIPYQLSALEGDNGVLSAVVVETLDGQKQTLKADYLLPFFGLSMNLGPILEWGLGMDKSHIRIDPMTGATDTPGIYAIGDVATYEHKLKLILTGFAEAAQAAHAIRAYLYPDETVHFEYSTTKGVPTSV
jgi:thioredoxin reductase (NADPH)